MTFLDEVRKKLDLPSAEKEQVMRELESHYHEVEDEALSTGMNECEASAEAARRLGNPSDIAQRMQAVHTRATWKMAFLTALPFLMFVFIATTSFLPILIGNRSLELLYPLSAIPIIAILLIGSIRELKKNRRPLWLATWLSAGILILSTIIDIAIRRPAISLINTNDATSETLRAIMYFAMQNSILMLILGSLTLWVYRRSGKWVLIIVGIMATGLSIHILLALTYYKNNPHYIIILPGITGGFFSAAIVTLLAARLFTKHPYGNVTQASLMLYALLLPEITLMIAMVYGDMSLIFWMTVLNLAISVFAVLAYSRMSNHLIKQWMLSAIIIIQGFFGIMAAPSLTSLETFNVSLIATILNLILIIFVPEMIDRHYKKRKPELAR